MIRLPLDDRLKIDLGKPVLTLDVNQIALRAPDRRPREYEHLASIEYNYFETGLLEAAVTPATALEITQGVPDDQLGSRAYARLAKSLWFKARPSGTTLTLDEQESDELWLDMRRRLFPTVSDTQLTDNQRADVNQLFCFSVSTGVAVFGAAFVTTDNNFLDRAPELKREYGLTIGTPKDVWRNLRDTYRMPQPTSAEVNALWKQQGTILARIRSGHR